MADELTLESALSLMNTKPEETPAVTTPAADPAAATAASAADPAVDPNTAPASDPAAGADPNAPADQGTTKADDVDQGALPLIEAPASWKTEEKEVWAALPRTAQEAISRREQASTSELRNLQNRTAEQQKTTDVEVTRLKGITGQIEAILTEKVADLAREFPEIKSEADIVALSQRDPARAQVFQAKLMALNAANQAKVAALGEVQKAAEKTQLENTAKAKDALLEAFPAWKDPVVARTQVIELQDYAIKNGASEATARATLDPVIYKLAQKAMLYDRAQTAKAAALTRTPAKTVVPGANNSDPKTAGKEESRRVQLGKLSNSGDIEDARGLLRV